MRPQAKANSQQPPGYEPPGSGGGFGKPGGFMQNMRQRAMAAQAAGGPQQGAAGLGAAMGAVANRFGAQGGTPKPMGGPPAMAPTPSPNMPRPEPGSMGGGGPGYEQQMAQTQAGLQGGAPPAQAAPNMQRQAQANMLQQNPQAGLGMAAARIAALRGRGG